MDPRGTDSEGLSHHAKIANPPKSTPLRLKLKCLWEHSAEIDGHYYLKALKVLPVLAMATMVATAHTHCDTRSAKLLLVPGLPTTIISVSGDLIEAAS